MPDIKKNILALQFEGWAWGWYPHSQKLCCFETVVEASERERGKAIGTGF